MKKFFNLLIITTISFEIFPSIIANSSYNQKETKFNIKKSLSEGQHIVIKREIPKSLLEQASTVNIGKIKRNDKEYIFNRLRTLNHPIFSQQNFIENFVIDSIIVNQATGHLTQAIRFGENINDIIPETISFTINFTADNYPLELFIRNRNLGNLENNSEYAILERLQELNRSIVTLNLHLTILEVNQTRALINIVNGTNHNIDIFPIEVYFTTSNFTFGSLPLKTNLGELPNNREGNYQNSLSCNKSKC